MQVRAVRYPAMTTPHGDAPQQFGHPSTWPAHPNLNQQPPPLPPGIPTQKPKTPWWFLFIVIPALAVAFLGAIYYENQKNGPSEPTDPAVADESRQAERACRQYVEQQLKAPATAKYQTPNTSRDGPEYTVTGTVDSQNSFGALIRTPYRCIVTSQGGGRWTLDDLRFEKS